MSADSESLAVLSAVGGVKDGVADDFTPPTERNVYGGLVGGNKRLRTIQVREYRRREALKKRGGAASASENARPEIAFLDKDGFPKYGKSGNVVHFYNVHMGPKEFYHHCCDYFRTHGTIEKEVMSKEGPTSLTLKFPWTVEGLCNHLHISKAMLMDVYYCHPNFRAFHPIVEWALNKMAQRLMEEGMAGNYNANMAYQTLLHYCPEYFERGGKATAKAREDAKIKLQVIEAGGRTDTKQGRARARDMERKAKEGLSLALEKKDLRDLNNPVIEIAGEAVPVADVKEMDAKAVRVEILKAKLEGGPMAFMPKAGKGNAEVF